VAATDKQTKTYRSIIYKGSYNRTKYNFKVEDLCGNLLGLNVSEMIKFKSGDTEKFTNC